MVASLHILLTVPCHLPGCFTISLSPVLVHIGPFAVYWYGLLIAVGFVAAVRLLLLLAEREQMDPDHTLSAALVAGLFGLLAARLFYIVTNQPGYYLDAKHLGEMLSLSTAGLSFFGGIAGAAFGAWLYASRNRLPLARLLDLAALAAPVGQAVGRVGNLINGDERGLLTNGTGVEYNNPNNPFVPPDRFARTSQPLALYQAVWDTALFLVLVLLYRRRVLRPGQLAGLYLVGYALGEIVVASFAAAPATLLGLKTIQLVAVVAAGAGLAVFLSRRRAVALTPAEAEASPEG